MCKHCDQKYPSFKKYFEEHLRIEVDRAIEMMKEPKHQHYLNNNGKLLTYQPACLNGAYSDEEIEDIFKQVNELIFDTFRAKFIKRRRHEVEG